MMKTCPQTTRFAPRARGALSSLVALCLVAGLLGPALAVASTPEAGERGNYRGQCKRLTMQIDHFEHEVLPMAIERRNRPWEDATNAQIERLWHRRADLCPEYGAQRSAMRKAADNVRKFNKLVAAAGRAAVTYFTGGLGGL